MMDQREQKIFEAFASALAKATRNEAPYTHWLIDDLFPKEDLEDLHSLSFPIGDLCGVSGKRELHNDTRHYFDQENIGKFPVVAAIANTLQSEKTVKLIEDFFCINLSDTYLRIEYAQDVEGFWLEPHTDLGVKKLTVLIYLSDGDDHQTLGTDIFDENKAWVARTPFAPNKAMAFVPGDKTYHGFKERPINGVRQSLILNYVTNEWRDREQLAFPDQPVSSS